VTNDPYRHLNDNKLPTEDEQLFESPPASLAPRLAASMIPGPPPVSTGMPAWASSIAVCTAFT
jgi:hypothetical protein